MGEFLVSPVQQGAAVPDDREIATQRPIIKGKGPVQWVTIWTVFRPFSDPQTNIETVYLLELVDNIDPAKNHVDRIF